MWDFRVKTMLNDAMSTAWFHCPSIYMCTAPLASLNCKNSHSRKTLVTYHICQFFLLTEYLVLTTFLLQSLLPINHTLLKEDSLQTPTTVTAKWTEEGHAEQRKAGTYCMKRCQSRQAARWCSPRSVPGHRSESWHHSRRTQRWWPNPLSRSGQHEPPGCQWQRSLVTRIASAQTFQAAGHPPPPPK